MTIPPSTSRRATDPVLIGLISELRYKAFGETRYSAGETPTTFRYTGQREEAELGLYYYNARWYDPMVGRFVSADTIVPGAGNPQGLNRYGYVYNNPTKHTDPTGNRVEGGAFPEDGYESSPFETSVAPFDGSLGGNAEKEPPPPDDELTTAELYGMVATLSLVWVSFTFAELVLIGIGIYLPAQFGPVGIATDLILLAPADLFLVDVKVSLARQVATAYATGRKPEFELTIYPLDSSLKCNFEGWNKR